ncbi:protein TASOR 2 isoform X3 [Ambystoma mexicanum]|uniref:protein TASOR 2 isoform X3 n=1 Tax=Ambystoma mexicanum TaxID=8296 RepID=UPI0037E9586E
MTKPNTASQNRTKRGLRGSSGGGKKMGNTAEEESSGPNSSAFHEVGQDSDPPFEAVRLLIQSSYLVPESENCFQYSQASLVTNKHFAEEFKTFGLQKRQSGYSQDELEETFAFLLFDHESEAKLVCQNGLCVGNSSITTLGDPATGVYVSKYADYLHPKPWHHGKAGYIVIFKIIKGKVKVVPENYTTSYTVPSPGYDCHVSTKNSKMSIRTSHFQAFELNQYFLYELNNGRVVTRPRQVCPYIILAFQYMEPKHTMQPKNTMPDKNRTLRNTDEYYSAWSGQLLILGKLVCDVAFQSPFSASLPAQLSDKLEVKDAMKICDLKRKLPEDIFDKCNYTDTEVCYDGVYCSLYDVMTSSSVDNKLSTLKAHMKSKELVIIKFLKDQGVLVLITSSLLKPSHDFGQDEPTDLHALFVFPSSRITCFTVGSLPKDAEEVKVGKRSDKMSSTVTSLLPGLKYALRQAKEAQLAETKHCGAQVEEYFQEFVRLRQGLLSPTDPQSGSSSSSSPLSFDMWPDFPTPKVCSKVAFSQLGTYISNSGIYDLQISKVLELFAGSSKSQYAVSIQSPETAILVSAQGPKTTVPLVTPPDDLQVDIEINGVDETSLVPQVFHTVEVRRKLNLKKSKTKRKVRRSVLSAKRRKKLTSKALLSAANMPVSLRRTTRVISVPKNPPSNGQDVAQNASETTLKLASAPFPHRRKRGAEILTAEVVHKTQADHADKGAHSEEKSPRLQKETTAMVQEQKVALHLEEKAALSPDRTAQSQEAKNSLSQDETFEPSLKRSKRLMRAPLKIIPAEEEIGKRMQKKNILKGKLSETGKPTAQNKLNLVVRKADDNLPAAGSKPLNRKTLLAKAVFENVNSFSKTIEAVVKSTTEREALRKRLPEELYESAGDVSVLAQRLNVYESHALNLLADLALSSGSAYNSAAFGDDLSIEEHQALLGEKLGRSVSDHEYSRVTKNSKGSSPILSSLCKSATLESESLAAVEEIHARQGPAKGQGFLSKVRADTSSPKKVTLEHSYASSTAEHVRRSQLLKGVPPSSTKNRGKGWQEGAPVGRVLPFRPQQDTACSPKESEFLAEKRKRGFIGQYKGSICPRTVFRRYGKVKVTFKWEDDYQFHGDSKYTSDPLEKTINRALHGPWDSDIPNHVEDVKLILHMWIALFYSKPSKLLNSASRKVVEHNNPAKYVSINSTLDSFELFEDCSDSEKVKVGLADSPSEVEEVAQDPTYINKSPAFPLSSRHVSSKEPSSTTIFGAQSHNVRHSVLDEGQQPVSSSGYFDSSCNYMLDPEPVQEICISESQANDEEAERNELLDPEIIEIDDNENPRDELMESEPFQEITSSVSQVEENEIEREYLVVPKTVADICASVPQVSVHGFEREELLKSVTVVEICSNVPQVEREELLESENDVDACGSESQVDENEVEREDFLESEPVEETCSSSASQVKENSTIEEVLEPFAVEDFSNSTPQVQESDIGREVLCEPEHIVEMCTSTSQVEGNLPEKETLLEPEKVVEVSTSVPQVDENPIEGLTEPESVVEICSSVSQVNEHETEREEVREPATVVEVCSSAPKVLCPILVSSFPEMQCRVLKKYIIAKKRGGQLTEWSTQLYNMVDATQVVRPELRRPPTVVDLSSSNIPQVFQVSESITGKDGFLSPKTVVDLYSSRSQITDRQRFRVHVDPFVEATENVAEEVVESEIVTDSFPYDSCYNTAVKHQSHSISHNQDNATHGLVAERPIHKDGGSTIIDSSDNMESVQPVYYETVVSESNPSTGDVFITLEDKEDTEAPSNETQTAPEEFALSHRHCDVMDYNSGVGAYVKNSSSMSMNIEVNEACATQSSFETQRTDYHKGRLMNTYAKSAAVSRVHSRGVHSFVGTEFNEARSSSDIRVEKCPSTGWVVYKHFSSQQNKLPSLHGSSNVACQKELLGPVNEDHLSSVTEQTSALEVEESVKNDREECVLYFDNIIDISPASTPDERLISNELELPEREFGEELIASKSPLNISAEPPTSPAKPSLKSPRHGVCAETAHENVDRLEESAAVPCADVQKDMTPGQRFDQQSSQHSGNNLKEPDCVPECSRMEVGDVLPSRCDDVVPRTKLKRRRCKNLDCEGGDCRCEHDSVLAEQWPLREKCIKKHKGFADMVKDDRYRPARTYRNFSVTKDVQETRVALRGLPWDPGFTERSDFLTSWTNRCVARDDITRSTLDLEYLRFIHNVNQVIKGQTIYTPTTAERFPFRKKPEARCRSPLVITVMRSEPRRASAGRRTGCYTHDDYEESSLKSRLQQQIPSARPPKKHRVRASEHATTFHFNRLNYKRKAAEQGQPSGVSSECALSSSLLPGDFTPGKPVTDQSTAPLQERSASEQQREPVVQKESSASVNQEPVLLQSIITDLCSNLRSRLNNVVSEACKKLLLFYILEIEEETYFSEIKTMLKRDGYSEMEPRQFCEAEHPEDCVLTVIMRNEDIAAHLQEIPDLLQLKMLPSVTFAGVDSPEDITDGTYQKVFHSGGFVVSDETILESVTLGQLQKILKLLEKLNRYERWRWLLHYRESKKLKEDARAESVAKKKDLLLKSCQESNIVEVLHYHQCDSKSAPKSEDLTCLLNLYIQHIATRFAIFLTDKPSIVEETCTRHGILVADVNTFVETVQTLASTFQIW